MNNDSDFNNLISYHSDKQDFLDNCKSEINALLWRYLPGTATLDSAERLACEIYNKIDEEWDK